MANEPSHGLSRTKLATIVAVVGFVLSALAAHLLLGNLAFGPSSEVKGVPTALAVAARLAYLPIIMAGGLIPRWISLRLGPERKMPLVDYLFTSLHWIAFLASAGLVISWFSLSSIGSGDAGSILMAVITIMLLPLDIGRVRWIACTFLSVASLLVFAMSPNPYALLAAIGCMLGAGASAGWDLMVAEAAKRKVGVPISSGI